MSGVNIGKLKREAVEKRYGTVAMEPRDVILLCERIEHLESDSAVVVTCNEAGDAVAVTRQDAEGRVLSVVWERVRS